MVFRDVNRDCPVRECPQQNHTRTAIFPTEYGTASYLSHLGYPPDSADFNIPVSHNSWFMLQNISVALLRLPHTHIVQNIQPSNTLT